MANIVEVRNLKLGEGIPKICVPLVGKTNEEILEEAKFLKNVKFDLIEWRVDHYENVENLEKVKEIVKALREEVGETVILFTFRRKKIIISTGSERFYGSTGTVVFHLCIIQ